MYYRPTEPVGRIKSRVIEKTYAEDGTLLSETETIEYEYPTTSPAQPYITYEDYAITLNSPRE